MRITNRRLLGQELKRKSAGADRDQRIIHGASETEGCGRSSQRREAGSKRRAGPAAWVLLQPEGHAAVMRCSSVPHGQRNPA